MSPAISRLRDLRISLGLTVREFANVMGVDIDTIHRWESGTAIPTFEQSSLLRDLLRLLERDVAPTLANNPG
ncbi:MAG: helix-turn-helix transcriptional regulator [Thermoanaerobaculia bacterium]